MTVTDLATRLHGRGWLAVVVLAQSLQTACATRSAAAPPDAVTRALCSHGSGDGAAVAEALIDTLQPEVEVAVLGVEGANRHVAAAWTYEARAYVRPASVHASSVRLGIELDGVRQPDVPLRNEVVAPLLGESIPAGHWEWVEVPPVCRLSAEPAKPECRWLTTMPLINPFAWALWPLFLPGKREVQRAPTLEDWTHIAPRTVALLRDTQRLLPDAPQTIDGSTTTYGAGIVVATPFSTHAHVVVSIIVDAPQCNRRVAVDARVALVDEPALQAWVHAHHDPLRSPVAALGDVSLRVLGTTDGLAYANDQAALDEYLRGHEGVSCSCEPGACRCRRVGPRVLESDSHGPFSWKTPLCCADPDWPAQGACACAPVGCSRSRRYGCVCDAFEGPAGPEWSPVAQCEPEEAQVCCQGEHKCACTSGRRDCDDGDVRVNACTPEIVTCRVSSEHPDLLGAPGFGVPVSSCSP